MMGKRIKNEIKVLVFGIIAEKMKTRSIQIENTIDTDTLRSKLMVDYPVFKDLTVSLAVNKKIVHSNTILFDGDEIALLPPFSGG
jgi:molybdopterin synthase sulfur carrier subunit